MMSRKIIALVLMLTLIGCAALADCSHKWSEWEVREPATDSARGIQYRKCTKCGEAEYVSFYPEGTLWNGMTGRTNDILQMQQMLSILGYEVNVDGMYSALTKQAVMQFQKDMGYEQTGIAYPQTLKALNGFTNPEYILDIPDDTEAYVYEELPYCTYTMQDGISYCTKHISDGLKIETLIEYEMYDMAIEKLKEMVQQEYTELLTTEDTELYSTASAEYAQFTEDITLLDAAQIDPMGYIDYLKQCLVGACALDVE